MNRVAEDARDAKTALQEWVQARGEAPPVYVEAGRSGPDHAPVFTIEGTDCLLETPKMGAVPLRVLKSPVTSLAQAQEQITVALDFLFQGY